MGQVISDRVIIIRVLLIPYFKQNGRTIARGIMRPPYHLWRSHNARSQRRRLSSTKKVEYRESTFYLSRGAGITPGEPDTDGSSLNQLRLAGFATITS